MNIRLIAALVLLLSAVTMTGAEGKQAPKETVIDAQTMPDQSPTVTESYRPVSDTAYEVPSFSIPGMVIEASSLEYGSYGSGGEAIVGTGSSDNYGVSSGYMEVSTETICVAGDADGSGAVDIDDVVYLINYIFSGGPEPVPDGCCGDANGSQSIDIDDVVYLIAYIFSGGPPPISSC